jgi:hypothetical protein
VTNDVLSGALGKAGLAERKAMIDPHHDLSISRQAKALGISRGSVYDLPRPVPRQTWRSCAGWTSCIWSSPLRAAGCCGTPTQEGTRIGRRLVASLRSGWAFLDRQTPDHASVTRLPHSAAA